MRGHLAGAQPPGHLAIGIRVRNLYEQGSSSFKAELDKPRHSAFLPKTLVPSKPGAVNSVSTTRTEFRQYSKQALRLGPRIR